MIIREYIKSDNSEIFKLFYNSVHSINRNNYSNDQLHVWAKKNTNPDEWCKKFENSYSLVAIENEKIIGFANVDNDGYLESIYIDKNFQNKKVATTLMNEIQKFITKNNKNELSTYSSVNAKSFFEKLGFKVESINILIRDKLELKNYYMKKAI